jgi:hypothetical protein
MKKAKFSTEGISGLLDKYDIKNTIELVTITTSPDSSGNPFILILRIKD